MRNLSSVIAAAVLVSCTNTSESEFANAAKVDMNSDGSAEHPVVSQADAAECDKAKAAAVSARSKYDRDYERRNPGFESMSLSADELTSCKLSAAGAFVGKWGGTRWRFVPKKGGMYSTDPKQVWVGENEGLDDLSWFSEWRADGTTVAKNKELNRLLKSARGIYG